MYCISVTDEASSITLWHPFLKVAVKVERSWKRQSVLKYCRNADGEALI